MEIMLFCHTRRCNWPDGWWILWTMGDAHNVRRASIISSSWLGNGKMAPMNCPPSSTRNLSCRPPVSFVAGSFSI
jgi:hypothetical protein